MLNEKKEYATTLKEEYNRQTVEKDNAYDSNCVLEHWIG